MMPVGQRQPGGGVVELDVAGEGGMAGEEDRGAEDREDGDRDRERQRVGAAEAPGHGEAGAEHRQGQDERHRQLGGAVGRRW